MNYYEHHLGDWAKKCVHLNCLEEGVYRRALDWYYTHEKPLPLGLDELTRQLRLRDDIERDTLQRVLNEFFEPLDDGWHQPRVDRELAKFREKQPEKADARAAWRERAQLSRARRRAMYQFLQAHGVTAPWNAGVQTLISLMKDNGFTPGDALGGADVTAGVTEGVTAPVTYVVTATQAPVTNHQSPEEIEKRTAMRAEVARAIRTAGFTQVNPLDPRFVALIDAGAGPEELALVGAEAAAQGKGWNWLLAVAKGRREDAKRPQEGPKSARQRTNEARLGEWVPELLPGAAK